MTKYILCILMFFECIFLSSADTSIKSEKECKSKNGTWAKFGLEQKYMCNLPTKDAGDPCIDSKFCQSECVINEPEGLKIKTGDTAEGKCYGYTIMIGTCLRRVHNGKATAVLCVD